MGTVQCKFCKSNCSANRCGENSLDIRYDCYACGTYYFSHKTASLWDSIDKRKEFGNFHLHCIAETIKANSEGLYPFWTQDRQSDQRKFDDSVTVKYFEDYENAPILHMGKTEGLLKIIAQKTHDLGPFDLVGLTNKDIFSLKIRDPKELNNWLGFLLEQDLIKQSKISSDVDWLNHCQYSLTPQGWQKIDQLFSGVHSKQAFIAMDFNNPERPEIQRAIEAACSKTGWQPFTIDQREYLGGISDRIIAEIKQSRFVVAEFTLNNHGVYYEAGYAAGKEIPVIYMVKESEAKANKLHFDTRHINHITWRDFSELTEKLINRIKAVIN